MEEVNKSWRIYEGHQSSVNRLIQKVEDGIVVEKGLQLVINGTPFTLTMRMPGHDEELAMGLLFAEDVVKTIENIHFNLSTTDKDIDQLNITLPAEQLREGYLNSRNFLSVSSCGVCGKTSLPAISSYSLQSSGEMAFNFEHLFKEMAAHQTVFSATGGCHAAAVFDKKGKLLVVREDIGRHNAVDKCIGHLLLTNQLEKGQILIVSGRVSYEIVIKCFRAKIGVLASVSAPSSLAIDYCKELGIKLFSFCRGERYTQYG
jgi:FdhD protein